MPSFNADFLFEEIDKSVFGIDFELFEPDESSFSGVIVSEGPVKSAIDKVFEVEVVEESSFVIVFEFWEPDESFDAAFVFKETFDDAIVSEELDGPSFDDASVFEEPDGSSSDDPFVLKEPDESPFDDAFVFKEPDDSSSVFVNSISIANSENSIIAGDKNGSVFSIASIALFDDSVKFNDIVELFSSKWFLNRESDSEKSVSSQINELARRIPNDAAFSSIVLSRLRT